MSHCRKILLVVLISSLIASASEKENIRIKVLDSETHSVVIDSSGVPKNCDQVNFDAYCNNSKSTQVTNTLLVQEADEPPFRITCAVDTRWSRCIPLSRGETFDAKRAKHGLVVYYVDDNGKSRSQLYTLVAGTNSAGATPAAAQQATVQPAPSARPSSSAPAAAPHPAAASTSASAPAVSSTAADQTGIKCDFTSTPAGADISIDGKYVGSTPSEIDVAAGTHVIGFTLSGFAPWQRELTVSAGSGVISVTASLQKNP